MRGSAIRKIPQLSRSNEKKILLRVEEQREKIPTPGTTDFPEMTARASPSYNQTPFLLQNRSSMWRGYQDPEGVRVQDCRRSSNASNRVACLLSGNDIVNMQVSV
jgi:hypothetical protein